MTIHKQIADASYWRKAYEDLVDQTGRDLNDGLGIDPRRTKWPAKSGRAAQALRQEPDVPSVEAIARLDEMAGWLGEVRSDGETLLSRSVAIEHAADLKAIHDLFRRRGA